MDFMEKTGVFNTRYEKWFEAAANVSQNDGYKQVCRLEQTCISKGAAQKYLITVTDVMILNHAVVVSTWLVTSPWDPGAQWNIQGVGPCKLPIDSLSLHLNSPSRLNSCWTWVNRLAETFRVQSQGSLTKMLCCNKCFHYKTLAFHIPPVTVTFGMLKESEKVTPLGNWWSRTYLWDALEMLDLEWIKDHDTKTQCNQLNASPLHWENASNKNGPARVKRRMQWEAPSKPLAVDDPLLLLEREVHAEICIN